ncbi:MOSC domain-containing protein [Rhizodiscina lignyota]|uniref:MOSC domain-containing protein n=1 Tax=Rhizodiscina lignyota TaxID=1504668 RepID=A0A9P4ILR9_9PEZI|nr:MOSC domain-containing protein [Rhizodiscina lignyota]
MKISQLYTYPVKSLRGISVTEAEAARNGFTYDRRFMLVKVEEYQGLPHRNMHLTYFPEMVLFTTALELPEDTSDPGRLIITFNPPEGNPRSLTVPLAPEANGLEEIDIDMHGSTTRGVDIGATYNSWFSSCFGFDVKFVYLGPNWRPVLMTTTTPQVQPSSWLSSITSNIPLLGNGKKEEERISFADCAPYLVTSEKSLENVSSRLEGEEMPMIKFRPNVVVSGASDHWEEDFWNEIAIGEEGEVRIVLAQNCARCASINIDYATGKPGTGDGGKVLKKLQSDRRVDRGAKYSPVFGRYGFVTQNVALKGKIRVGDDVRVVGRNDKHTVFDWPGLTTA